MAAVLVTLSAGLAASHSPVSARSAAPAPVGPPPIATANVTYVGTVPLDVPAVSGRVVTRQDLGNKKYFYVFGAYGVTIYDLADPALPLPVGRLNFASSQNEDFKVSDDGKRAVIAADGSLPFSPNAATTGIHIVDTSDVANPRIVGSTSALVTGTGTGRGAGEHTATCAEATCSIIYGSSSGNIYDATNPADIRVVGVWAKDKAGNNLASKHALHRDPTGLITTDSKPRLVLDPIGLLAPGATPTKPVLLTQGMPHTKDSALQHNNIRPDAKAWAPRPAGVPVERRAVPADPRVESLVATRPVLAPGELLLGGSESNVNQNCASAAGISTWSMANFDKGQPLEQLELFRPLRGQYVDGGNPPANVGGCSSHWFEEDRGIIVASWYEHGTRFLQVDKTVGTLKEVGYYQPVAGIANASYWVNDEYVYTTDNLRGFDILRFDRTAPPAPQAQLDASWLAARPAPATASGVTADHLRLSCVLAAT